MNNNACLLVKSRPIGHYALSLFSLMFRNGRKNFDMHIIGIGQSTRRVLNLANGMAKEFSPNHVKVKKVKIGTYNSKPSILSKLDVTLHYSSTTHHTYKSEKSSEMPSSKLGSMWDEYQELTICQLEFILSTLLSEGCSFELSSPDYMKISGKGLKKVAGSDFDLGTVEIKNDELVYEVGNKPNCKTARNDKTVKNWTESALIRMGILTKGTFKNFAEELSRHDDVIIGLDTNNFYKANVTAGLLDSLVGVTHTNFLDLPNWITFVASEVSISELENRATGGEEVERKSGKIDWIMEDNEKTRYKRYACRGLQEFMEIGMCIDLEGVTIILTGDIPSHISLSEPTNTIRDETIRKQIRSFFQAVNFHKGAYFITGDKMNQMFAEAEGLKAFYAERRSWQPGNGKVKDNEINLTQINEEEDIHNISELIYELGIEVPLKITCSCSDNPKINGLVFTVKTDWATKLLEKWENRVLKVKVGFDKEALKKIDNEIEEKNEKIREMGNSSENQKGKGGNRSKNEQSELKALKDYGKAIKELNDEMKGKRNEVIKILENNAKAVDLDSILKAWKEINAMHHGSSTLLTKG